MLRMPLSTRGALYFTFSVEDKRIWTVTDILNETGWSRPTVLRKIRDNDFPGKRINPNGKHPRFYDSKKIRDWIQANKKPTGVAPRKSRAGQRLTSRRRVQKIEKLFEILNNQTEVSVGEKERAICFCDCLIGLYLARLGWHYPLLEGIEALYREGAFQKYFYQGLVEAIERLPTTPQTEQSFSDASEK